MVMANVVSQVEAPEEKTIDREKVCPLLLRVFCANGRHNPLSEYGRGTVPSNELQIYTWMDCNLRELMALIKEVNPDARRRGTVFDFAIMAPDRYQSRYTLREVGNTMNGNRGVDDNKTLSACKFEIGDYMDVAITVPQVDGRRDFGRPPFRGGGGDDFGGGGQRGGRGSWGNDRGGDREFGGGGGGGGGGNWNSRGSRF